MARPRIVYARSLDSIHNSGMFRQGSGDCLLSFAASGAGFSAPAADCGLRSNSRVKKPIAILLDRGNAYQSAGTACACLGVFVRRWYRLLRWSVFVWSKIFTIQRAGMRPLYSTSRPGHVGEDASNRSSRTSSKGMPHGIQRGPGFRFGSQEATNRPSSRTVIGSAKRESPQSPIRIHWSSGSLTTIFAISRSCLALPLVHEPGAFQSLVRLFSPRRSGRRKTPFLPGRSPTRLIRFTFALGVK